MGYTRWSTKGASGGGFAPMGFADRPDVAQGDRSGGLIGPCDSPASGCGIGAAFPASAPPAGAPVGPMIPGHKPHGKLKP